MKQTNRRRFVSVLAAITTAIMLLTNFTVLASDQLPMQGKQARKENQPKFHGYRIWDIEDWSPESDPDAEFLKAKIPLQKRIDPFKDTQANPSLDSDAQIMLMQGEYGNAFVDGMMYNNTFSYLTLNYWQYIDYFSPWHGAATAYVPENLYDWQSEMNDGSAWMQRHFEFGILNIPNPAYTNAAHRNGVMSIACIYFDQSNRQGQTINELFIKDDSGEFVVAKKLIEMAKYFGYDGYFFNREENPEDEDTLRKFLATLEAADLYTQYYDINHQFDKNKASYLQYPDDTKKIKIQDSVFLDYGGRDGNTKDIANQAEFAENNGYNMFENVFYGFECKKGTFAGNGKNIRNMYALETQNPRASVALFTPSDYYQNSLDEDLGTSMPDKNLRADSDYQWMIMERERMFFSGMNQDPTNTGSKPGFSYPDVGINGKLGDDSWVGVADFTSERSVIGGSTFYTNFNTGRGLQFFNDGKVTNNEEWSNITLQDLLPTWQWWIDSKAENKLKADFDFGEKYKKALKGGSFKDLGYTGINAYKGGSSLVVYGDLEDSNELHLFKTELDVKANSELCITYNKQISDNSTMEIALIFKDNPNSTVYLPVINAGNQTNGWETAKLKFGSYAGEKIAAIGVRFDNEGSPISNYQMNIGEIKVVDGEDHTPAKPEGFEIDRVFSTGEVVVTWNLADFKTVNNYEIFAEFTDGTEQNLGGIYDGIYYIKTLLKDKGAVKLKLYAIGKDGSKSEPASIDWDFSKVASDISIKTTNSTNGNVRGMAEKAGVIDVSWKNPEIDYKELRLEVSLDETKAEDFTDEKPMEIVPKETEDATIQIPWFDGENFQVAVTTVDTNGNDIATIHFTGKVNDSYSAPYDVEKATVERTSAIFGSPDSNDWWRLHVSVDGTPINFNARFIEPEPPYAIRGCTYLDPMIPESGMIKIVVEDYAGNLSEPVYLRASEVDNTLFPDEELRKWVLDKVGNSESDVLEYTGTLDLSDLNIQDFTGVSLFKNVKEISVSGNPNVSKIQDLNLPLEIEKVDISNTNIEAVSSAELTDYTSLTELNISGAYKLQYFDVSNSTLKSLKVDDIQALGELFYIDLRDTEIDVREGSPARELADWIDLNQTDRNKSYSYGQAGNLALTADISGTFEDLKYLIDGSTYDASNAKEKDSFILDLGASSILDTITLNFQGYYFAAATEFTYEVSDDREEWASLATIYNDSDSNTYSVNTNKTPRYLRVTFTKSYEGYGIKVTEITVNGRPDYKYPSAVYYDGQSAPDYTKLKELYEKMSNYNSSKYTLSSWEVAQKALDLTEQALAYEDPAITKREIADCMKLLSKADENLDLLEADKDEDKKKNVETDDENNIDVSKEQKEDKKIIILPKLNTQEDKAYISGYEDGTVRPSSKVTREEVAAIFYNLLSNESKNHYKTASNGFNDVGAGLWSNNAISVLAKAGVISGYTDGTFRPKENISRAELVAIAEKFSTLQSATIASPFKDTSGHWAEDMIKAAYKEGWVSGYENDTFKPNNKITRAETITIVNKVLGKDTNDINKIVNMKTWSDNADTNAWYYKQIQLASNSY